MTEKSHRINESADKVRVETKVKRGSGTRDQDTIKVVIKSDDPVEAVAKLDATLGKLRETATTVREIQPEAGGDE